MKSTRATVTCRRSHRPRNDGPSAPSHTSVATAPCRCSRDVAAPVAEPGVGAAPEPQVAATPAAAAVATAEPPARSARYGQDPAGPAAADDHLRRDRRSCLRALGAYAKVHDPTGKTPFVWFFSGQPEFKVWFATLAAALALFQEWVGRRIYGKHAQGRRKPWMPQAHRLSGTLAFIVPYLSPTSACGRSASTRS